MMAGAGRTVGSRFVTAGTWPLTLGVPGRRLRWSKEVDRPEMIFVANAGLALYCPPEEARSLILLTILFVAGRILFWIGYHYNPLMRAFGFGIGFYPTVAAFAWLMLMMVFGIRVPL